jgi:hypothetical protein
MILEIVFVVFFIICCLGCFAPSATMAPGSIAYRGGWGILLLLIGILGYCVFNGVK